jgi:hypothetical protein
MVIKHAAAVTMVGAALAASGVLLSQSCSTAPASPDPTRATAETTEQVLPIEELVVRSAGKAALLQLCRDGLADPEAYTNYQQAREAHPNQAANIGPDCQLTSPAP